MNKQLNIFLATDYSESVMNAEKYAFEFAKKANANLTILHVYEIPFSFPFESTEYVKSADRLRKFEMQKLKLHCESILHSLKIKLNEVNWECMTLEGAVGKEIRKEAERSLPDMIITGTHNNSNKISVFQSSHTWNIIKKSNVPILAIPKNALLTDIKKIVFATEYRQGEIPGIESMIKLSAKFDAELTILHITNNSFSKEFANQLFEKFKTEVQNKVSYKKLSLRLVFADNIVSGINDFCFTSKSDWLVMSHSRPFFLEKVFLPEKSITKEMVIEPLIPLLSVPDFYETAPEEQSDSISETIHYNKGSNETR